MEFTTLIQSRRSIRNYKSTPVPADIVDKLCLALQSAPTGSNNHSAATTSAPRGDSRHQSAYWVATLQQLASTRCVQHA